MPNNILEKLDNKLGDNEADRSPQNYSAEYVGTHEIDVFLNVFHHTLEGEDIFFTLNVVTTPSANVCHNNAHCDSYQDCKYDAGYINCGNVSFYFFGRLLRFNFSH